MVLTEIGKQNEEYFAPLLMGTPVDESILRFGVIDEGKACGVLAASVNPEESTILQLYISERERKKGYATALMSAFLRLMESAGVSSVTAAYGKDEGLDRLFAKLGFLVLPGDEVYMISIDDLLSSEQVKKLREREVKLSGIRTLSSLSPTERAWMLSFLAKERITEETFLALDPDPELSAVIWKEDETKAILLAGKAEDKCLVQFLCNGDKKAPINLQNLLIHLTKQVLCDPDFKQLCFYAEDEHMVTFAEKLSGDPKLLKTDVLNSIASLAFGDYNP